LNPGSDAEDGRPGRLIPEPTSETVLVLSFLTVRSSYITNVEEPTAENPDTVQFWFAPGGHWRIKTFAIDEDVHVWRIDLHRQPDFVAFSVRNTEKHYGDVLHRTEILRASGGIEGIKRALEDAGLTPNLEVSEEGFAFWAPSGSCYRTKSRPRDA
jgi:hypothetical protein